LSTAGLSSTTNGTGTSVPDLNLATAWRSYVAESIVRVGASGFHLLVPATRKRLNQIVVEVDNDLLRQLLTLRGESIPAETDLDDLARSNVELRECNAKQTNQLLQRDADIERLKRDVKALTDQREDVERRLGELQVAFVARGSELSALKLVAKIAQERLEVLEPRCKVLETAIRKVLNPDSVQTLRTAWTAFRTGLVTAGFSPRSSFPFFSAGYWNRAMHVPEWFFHRYYDLSSGQDVPMRYVAEALHGEVADILQPALSSTMTLEAQNANSTSPVDLKVTG